MSQKLALVFPDIPQRQRLVALPLCLLMAWKLYPLYFCADTKTIASITNTIFKIASKEQAFHQLDKRANNISVKQGGPASISVHGKTPSKGGDFYWWLYSDSTRRRERALRTKQYIIHSDWCEVFWANDKKDTNTSHKEPISLKKARPER